jgi:hypothetical protein
LNESTGEGCLAGAQVAVKEGGREGGREGGDGEWAGECCFACAEIGKEGGREEGRDGGKEALTRTAARCVLLLALPPTSPLLIFPLLRLK